MGRRPVGTVDGDGRRTSKVTSLVGRRERRVVGRERRDLFLESRSRDQSYAGDFSPGVCRRRTAADVWMEADAGGGGDIGNDCDPDPSQDETGRGGVQE